MQILGVLLTIYLIVIAAPLLIVFLAVSIGLGLLIVLILCMAGSIFGGPN